MNQHSSFVRVSGDRLRLVEANGRPCYFCGANCYYLMTRAADPATRHECTAMLDDAAAAGITVLRTWAFADGEQWGALQTRPGVFEERTFRALDWVVAEAGRRGLRLILNLTNYWKDYGGMRQYVQWAYEARGQQPPMDGSGQVAAEPFYTDPDCQRMFRAYMAAVVRRVNSLTGVRYCDDPTILAWGLANEPRCDGDRACTVVPFWADAMARHLKSLDPHHLVTLDVEGFLGPSTPDEAECSNPYNCSGSGCDFAADCGSPAIDFACAHMYPDLWLPQADEQERLRFALSWVDCHVALARRLGKPLVLSEWGKQRGKAGEATATGGSPRAAFYAQVLGRCLQHMQAGGLAGTAFWMIAAPSYPDHDGFTVYFGTRASSTSSGNAGAVGSIGSSQPGQAPLLQAGERTAAVIRQHAATVALLNGRPEVAYGQVPPLMQPPASAGGPIGGSGSGAAGHHLPLPAVGGGHGQVVHSGGSSHGRFCYYYCCCPQM